LGSLFNLMISNMIRRTHDGMVVRFTSGYVILRSLSPLKSWA